VAAQTIKVIRLSEHDRLLEERARLLKESAIALGVKVNERDEQIRLLTDSAVALELKFKADLQRMLSLLSSENTRLQAHNELLTASATEAVRKLQEIEQNDHQIRMAQQQLLAGMRDADPRFNDIYSTVPQHLEHLTSGATPGQACRAATSASVSAPMAPSFLPCRLCRPTCRAHRA
jgi:hypothetical protein